MKRLLFKSCALETAALHLLHQEDGRQAQLGEEDSQSSCHLVGHACGPLTSVRWHWAVSRAGQQLAEGAAWLNNLKHGSLNSA